VPPYAKFIRTLEPGGTFTLYTGGGAAKSVAGALSDFDNDQGIAVEADNIQLTQPIAPISERYTDAARA